VWLGGLVTVVLFTVGKTAIGAYLGQASVGSAYGAAGLIVVLLMWVCYSALIVFFGAEFTQAWATRQGPWLPGHTPCPGRRPRPRATRPPSLALGCERGRSALPPHHSVASPTIPMVQAQWARVAAVRQRPG
jgi:uncharacterized BrkB/YihY/UPF0761 family membrane protein